MKRQSGIDAPRPAPGTTPQEPRRSAQTPVEASRLATRLVRRAVPDVAIDRARLGAVIAGGTPRRPSDACPTGCAWAEAALASSPLARQPPTQAARHPPAELPVAPRVMFSRGSLSAQRQKADCGVRPARGLVPCQRGRGAGSQLRRRRAPRGSGLGRPASSWPGRGRRALSGGATGRGVCLFCVFAEARVDLVGVVVGEQWGRWW